MPKLVPKKQGAWPVNSPKPELVWQGRIQLGDEPGTFADASYSGLSVEFPLTVRNIGATGGDTLTLLLNCEHVSKFANYPGHLIKVFYYQESKTPYHWDQVLYKDYRLDKDQIQLDIDLSAIKQADPKKNIYLSVSVEIDTEVTPGLYNDFVLLQLNATSDNYKYVCNLGFDYY